MLLLQPAIFWVLINWRREIGLAAIITGLAATLIAFFGGMPFYRNGYIKKVAFIVLLAIVMPMFVAGGLV